VKRVFSGLMLIALLISMLPLVCRIEPAKASIETRTELARIIERPITTSELGKLKRSTGVGEEGKSYNQMVNGHGTGLRPPTEKEWTKIATETYVVEKVVLGQGNETPTSIDHSADPWFPPIGNQDGQGSCTAWAVGYYTKTYQEAKEHGWNVSAAQWWGDYYGYPSQEYQDKIISPAFIYHLINWGEDHGSSFYDAINLVCAIGASSWKTMPYKPTDYSTWPSEQAWREAALYRGNSSGFEDMLLETDEDLMSLKNWLAAGNLAVMAVDANLYYGLTDQDVWTVDNYRNPNLNHANTIVGYDDNFTYVEEGEVRQGVFKIANSWGVGSWEKAPDGFYWISYKAMKQIVGYCMFYRDRIAYEPELFASFKINHTKRGECDITIGMTDYPNETKWFSEYIQGGNRPFPAGNIVVDITEIKNAVPRVYDRRFFLRVWDGESSTTGTIQKFVVETAQSEDTPLGTVNNGVVYAYVKLLRCFDMNSDGEVDIADIFQTASAYGSYPGHPNWNLHADINGDDEVDIMDIFLVAKNFGKTYP
jgi:hypothetical protein